MVLIYKKLKTFHFIFIIIIILLLFTACTSQTITDKSTNQNTTENTTNYNATSEQQNENSTQKIESLNDGSNLEKVIFSYFREKLELPYTEDAKKFLNDISNCTDIPKATLTDRIGVIDLKYKNNDKLEEFASVYLGSDNKIYIKCEKNADKNYAYMLDLDNALSELTTEEN